MLDLRAVREDPERFRAGLARRHAAEHFDRLLELDAEQRALKVKVEELRAEQNRVAKSVGRASPGERPKLVEEGKRVGADLRDVEPDLERTTGRLEELLAELPNLPDETVPDGEGDLAGTLADAIRSISNELPQGIHFGSPQAAGRHLEVAKPTSPTVSSTDCSWRSSRYSPSCSRSRWWWARCFCVFGSRTQSAFDLLTYRPSASVAIVFQ